MLTPHKIVLLRKCEILSSRLQRQTISVLFSANSKQISSEPLNARVNSQGIFVTIFSTQI